MFKRVLNNTDGFSLIEIVLALFVLAIGILGYMSLFGGSVRGTKFSGDYTSAVTLAQSQLDKLFNASFDSPILSMGFHGPINHSENGFSANSTYRVISGNSSTTSNATLFYKRIKLDVVWAEGGESNTLTFRVIKKRD